MLTEEHSTPRDQVAQFGSERWEPKGGLFPKDLAKADRAMGSVALRSGVYPDTDPHGVTFNQRVPGSSPGALTNQKQA